jgi:glycosyltransferase involved in cell wall biosynthesis
LISVWGNDFTLHADRSRIASAFTQRAMRRADGLHTDCKRDFRLAVERGFDSRKPAIALPGAGGIRPEIFYSGRSSEEMRIRFNVPSGAPVIVNPRGFREYVHNREFFRAVRLVLERYPSIVVLCSSMENDRLARTWVREQAIEHAVRLLPTVDHAEMADLFRLAQVVVSPSAHDGTPNSLLEAMACGCFPVAGDIESVREWISDGVNGLLCDPADPASIAAAIVRAVSDADLRTEASAINQRVVAERANYDTTMLEAERLYDRVIRYRGSRGSRAS